jgi:hypothetical protein
VTTFDYIIYVLKHQLGCPNGGSAQAPDPRYASDLHQPFLLWGVSSWGDEIKKLLSCPAFRCFQNVQISWASNWLKIDDTGLLLTVSKLCRIGPNLEASADAARMESRPFTPGFFAPSDHQWIARENLHRKWESSCMDCFKGKSTMGNLGFLHVFTIKYIGLSEVYHPSDPAIWRSQFTPWICGPGPHLHAASQASCANCGHLCANCGAALEAMNHWIDGQKIHQKKKFRVWLPEGKVKFGMSIIHCFR